MLVRSDDDFGSQRVGQPPQRFDRGKLDSFLKAGDLRLLDARNPGEIPLRQAAFFPQTRKHDGKPNFRAGLLDILGEMGVSLSLFSYVLTV